ncbi:MAG: FHA domain-containing protein [Myxococcales bacterium]|nr:FHA domain-containing protein [Myxococcales bacterium]
MITCPKCAKENQDHYKFCLGCGAELPRDAAPKAFAPKTPPHGMKAAPAAAPPAAGPPPVAPPPAAPPVAPPPAAPVAAPPPVAAPAPPPAPIAAPPPAPVAAPPRPAPVPAPAAPIAPPVAAPVAAPAPPPVAAPVAVAAPPAAPAATGPQVTCPTCGFTNPPSNKFCQSCGTVLTGLAAAASVPPPPAAAGAPGSATLTALRADGTDAGTFNLPAGSTTVGRDLGGVFGGDSYLSPKHATFKVNGGKITVRDESSLNGVYLKIARDTPTELKSTDIFRIGQELIRFERLQAPAPSADGVERLGSPADGIVGRLLLVTGRDTTGNAFTIPAHGIHMGRERGDVIFPEDGYVSGLHCRIAPEAGRMFLTDLGSSNGTYVRLNEEREVHSGDVILMGQQLFRVGV